MKIYRSRKSASFLLLPLPPRSRLVHLFLFASFALPLFESATPRNSAPILDAPTNEIVGEPFVSCAADAIYAKWKTRTAFVGGRVSVRYAPSNRPNCYQTLVTNNQIELLIPHLECRLNRLRILEPPGLLIEASVLISFHGEFISAGDRLFRLKCLHAANPNASNNNNDTLLVLPTVAENAQSKMQLKMQKAKHSPPKCFYDILLKDSEGHGVPLRERLHIGAQLLHKWSCVNVRDSHCLVVTNCVLRTPDDEHKIVDEFGCSSIPDLVPQLDYSSRTEVSGNIAVFTISEPSYIYFQCQLSLADLSLENVTCPTPKCGRHSSRNKRSSPSNIMRFIQNANTTIVDLVSERIEVGPFVADEDERYADAELTLRSQKDGSVLAQHQKNKSDCVSITAAALLSLASLVSAITVTSLLLLRLMRDRFYQVMSQ